MGRNVGRFRKGLIYHLISVALCGHPIRQKGCDAEDWPDGVVPPLRTEQRPPVIILLGAGRRSRDDPAGHAQPYERGEKSH